MHRAQQGLDAGGFDLTLDPSGQPHFVVLKRDRAGHRDAAVQRAFGGEVGNEVVGDAVRDLVRLRSVRDRGR